MEIYTIQKYLHTSPRKLRLVSDMVRKMDPPGALAILRLTPKAAAKDLEKAISTVLANAKTAGLDASKLAFKRIEINESTKMRRFRAGTRGRVKPYKKRMAHIKIILTDDLDIKGKILNIKNRKQQSDENADKGKETEVKGKAK